AIYGGTGQTIYTIGDILYASATNTLAKLAGSAGFLKSTGVAAPSWSAVNLGTADVTSTLPVARGGTGLNATGTANQLLGMNSAASALEYKTLSGTANRLTVTHTAGTATLDIAATYLGQTSITTLGTITTGEWQGTAIGTQWGGTGLTSLTQGYIPFGKGTSAFGSSANLFWDEANSRLGIGTSSPSTLLHVYGTSTLHNVLPQTTNTYTLGSSTYKWANLYAATTTIGDTIVIGTDSISATSTLTISTDNSAHLILSPSGNVGIGTAIPSA
ncbi:unnamed protein product, partial [marine sediment metagenome]